MSSFEETYLDAESEVELIVGGKCVPIWLTRYVQFQQNMATFPGVTAHEDTSLMFAQL